MTKRSKDSLHHGRGEEEPALVARAVKLWVPSAESWGRNDM